VTSIDIPHKFLGLKFDSECPRECATLILTLACWTRPASNLTPEICVKPIFRLPQYIFELPQKLVLCKLYPAYFRQSEYFHIGPVSFSIVNGFSSKESYIMKGRTRRFNFRYFQRKSDQNWCEANTFSRTSAFSSTSPIIVLQHMFAPVIHWASLCVIE
jgi:hypothetical protein